MKIFRLLSIYCLFLLPFITAFPQQIKFNRVIDGSSNNLNVITGIAQDQQGYIWFSTFGEGFYQYNGLNIKAYVNDSLNRNSLANNNITCVAVDSSGFIWIGTMGSGLDRYDPATKTFFHFTHNPKNISSLSNDTISTLYVDRSNNLWIGTRKGLNLLDRIKENFIRYTHKETNTSSISHDHVFSIYEDRQGTLWVGCGIPNGFGGYSEAPEEGGLNRFNKSTGKFTHYLHGTLDSNSISNNKVTAITEDSKGNFWVGTANEGLNKMNRETGKFTHYFYDSANPEKLSRPPLFNQEGAPNYITFIKEDINGGIWIGSMFEGMNRFDPITKKITHYGYIFQLNKALQSDTTSGFNEQVSNTPFRAISSNDGWLWMGTSEGNLYNVNFSFKALSYFNINTGGNSFYEDGDSILWIGTDSGLIEKNRKTSVEKKFVNQAGNTGSLSNNSINILRADVKNNLWISTYGGGLNKFDLQKRIFTRYLHDPANNTSIAGDTLFCIYIDKEQNIWIGITHHGIDKMEHNGNHFIHYSYDSKDSNSLSNIYPNCITADTKNNIWIGTQLGLNRLDQKKNRFYHYLQQSDILSLCVDSFGKLWAATSNSIYTFNPEKDEFTRFKIEGLPDVKGILHILEDDQKNLWVSIANSIIKINPQRNAINVFGKKYGVHSNNFYLGDNYQAKNGEIFIGDQSGYYAFFPNQLKESLPPQINISSFILDDKEQLPVPGSVLKQAIWKTKEIKLNYKQNTFSFDFDAIDYNYSGEIRYAFMLENYDNVWHNLGTDHKAYFFNLPAGQFVFHLKAVNGEGAWTEKLISIIISPPWWKTWWAYLLFAVIFIAAIYSFIAYRSRNLKKQNKLLEDKVTIRTQQLNKSLEELKSTQAQLIQSEKMASLGELTAGIAHEIQNPLNFVNNFSDVNKELLEELKEEADRGNIDEIKAIVNDVISNEEKINHHGKRADSIVKGMLQHSKKTSGQKELTDINALADEYLRLSYHGLRAKDKSFNAEIKTDFDDSIGLINIIPQDISRVLLNLFNNAFYTVNEKKAPGIGPPAGQAGYEPTVSVSTRKTGNSVTISVSDNGNGIPQNIVDKIFQPFFTTKPTGQGTGLGLSLSYDIVKAHGGEIKVETKDGGGSEFTIQLPLNT